MGGAGCVNFAKKTDKLGISFGLTTARCKTILIGPARGMTVAWKTHHSVHYDPPYFTALLQLRVRSQAPGLEGSSQGFVTQRTEVISASYGSGAQGRRKK